MTSHVVTACDLPPESVRVHWHGKLLEDITGNETVDRLPILISGSGKEQLLGVPKIDRGTG